MAARNHDTRSEPNRRDFLRVAGVGVGAAIGSWRLEVPTVHRSLGGAGPSQFTADDYLFSPGLVYFGTATLGPCPRKVVEATIRAWYELETNPTAMGYGDGATLARAERTREQAAALLGCALDEIVLPEALLT